MTKSATKMSEKVKGGQTCVCMSSNTLCVYILYQGKLSRKERLMKKMQAQLNKQREFLLMEIVFSLVTARSQESN